MVASIGKVVDPEYYTGDVAEDRHDYYAGHGEAAGRWTGKLAAALGLDGQVHTETFADVLGNVDPATGGKLKPRANYKTLAYDVTFSPVKSISVLWALAPEHVRAQVLAALEGGHAEALRYLESTACVARLGRDGTDPQPGTGFATAVFRHRFSREADPQTHFHTVIANVTQAPDGRRAALDGTLLWAHARVADARMQTYARAELTARLDAGWDHRRGHWDLKGVPAGLARVFSKRRVQIEADQAERGGDGARDAQTAALRTRQAKKTAPDGENVHTRWTGEAAAAGYDVDRVVADAAPRTPAPGRDAELPDEFAGIPAAGDDSGFAPGRGVRAAAGDDDLERRLVDRLLGPEGLTEQASSFGRRDVLVAIANAVPVLGPDGPSAVARLDALADRVLSDPRVIALLNPTVTAGEVIRPRDEHGRITGVVRTQTERRWSTADLLAAEAELLTRAQQRADAGVAVVPQRLVDAYLAPDGPGGGLDADQAAMVRRITTSGAAVDVVVGKAGTGKTTAIDAGATLYAEAGIRVRGVAPSATAAHQLTQATGMPTSTLDLLLTQLDHGLTTLAPGEVVVLDEAAMCSTRNRLRLQQAVDAVDGKVVDVGDARQIPSVDVGGTFHALGNRLGAVTLGVNHRFRLPIYRDAADLLWHGEADKAIALLEAAGEVYEHDHPDVVHRQMVNDWADTVASGADARMYATTHTTVDLLNRHARSLLREQGLLPRKGRRYRSADRGNELEIVVGERVRLGRNQAGVTQPDGAQVRVRNGMEGTVTATDRRGITVALDPEHRGDDGRAQVFLPAGYVGEYDHLNYSYARTADSCQGATIDHALFGVPPLLRTPSVCRGFGPGRRSECQRRIRRSSSVGR